MKKGFRIAARGLLVQDEKLLLVSDEGKYWYLPGGGLEQDESLTDCVERELYEETGISVTVGPLLFVMEYFDIKDKLHKINFFFETQYVKGSLSQKWEDKDAVVQFARFWSLKEIQNNEFIVPQFLAKGQWTYNSFYSKDCSTNANTPKAIDPYLGCYTYHGYNLVTHDKIHDKNEIHDFT